MEHGLVFWNEYFKSQQEVTWDEFSKAFSSLLLTHGKIHLDEDQLYFLKSLIDPDYRNVVKVAHYLIFQQTFWSIQSKKQLLFKHQFERAVFAIPPQKIKGLTLTITATAKGYTKGERMLFVNAHDWIKTSHPQSTLDPNVSPYLQSMHLVQSPQREYKLKCEEVFVLGSCDTQSDFVVEGDLQMNPAHLKFVWTPYNLFLVKDVAKSFRATLRLAVGQFYLMDFLSVYKLGPETSFYVKQIQPLPCFEDNMMQQNVRYLETAQEHAENYFPYLVQQLKQHNFRSVTQYRHAIDAKELDTPNQQISKQFQRPTSTTTRSTNLSASQLIPNDGPYMQIEFCSGALKGQTMTLDQVNDSEYLIGRSKACRIQLADHFLENEQARIIYNKDYGWLIQHIGVPDESMDPTVFGTFLMLANKLQLDLGLPGRAHVLQKDMVICVGPYLMQASY